MYQVRACIVHRASTLSSLKVRRSSLPHCCTVLYLKSQRSILRAACMRITRSVLRAARCVLRCLDASSYCVLYCCSVRGTRDRWPYKYQDMPKRTLNGKAQEVRSWIFLSLLLKIMYIFMCIGQIFVDKNLKILVKTGGEVFEHEKPLVVATSNN